MSFEFKDAEVRKMKLFERPVDLPELVVLVDDKSGKEIGFVKRVGATVFEDGCTGKFMLAYDPDGARKKVIVLETEDVIRFLSVVEEHLDTAMAADDPKLAKLGVSYEDRGRAYVLYMRVRNETKAFRYLNDFVVGESEAESSPTGRLIELFRRRIKAEGKA